MHASDPSGSFPDPSSACMDYRFGEISSWAYSSCRYDGSGARDYYGVLYDPQRLRGIDDSGSGTGAHGRRLAWPHPDDAVRAVAAGADGIPPVPPNYVSAVHTPVDYTTRTLGPHNRRDVHLRVLPPSAVWPDPHLGWPSVAAAVPNAIPHEGYPSLRVRRYTLPAASESAPRPAGYPDSIDFIEGDGSAGGSGLWVAALPGQTGYNPFMTMAAGVGPLFGALHANASRHRWTAHGGGGDAPRERAGGSSSGSGGGGPSFAQAGGPSWPLPSLDAVAFVGAGLEEIRTPGDLSPWFHGVLHNTTLGAMRGTAKPPPPVLWKDAQAHFSPSRLLCARHGFMPSFKPKIFSSQAAAHAFRVAAYEGAGILRPQQQQQAAADAAASGGGDSAPADPDPGLAALPRRVTLLDRAALGGRSWFHVRDVRGALASTGLQVAEVPRMDFLSWAAQVEAMARTGILIAPHGAHLMNAMFLPRGAVLIEVAPPLLKSPTFSNLAHTMGLRYLPLYARAVLPQGFQHMWSARVQSDPEWHRECVGRNVSGYDTLRVSLCNRFSKAHPMLVPMRALRRVLAAAVELLLLPAGAADAATAAVRALLRLPPGVTTGYPPPPPPGVDLGPHGYNETSATDAGPHGWLGGDDDDLVVPPLDDPALTSLFAADPDVYWTPVMAQAWAAATGDSPTQ